MRKFGYILCLLGTLLVGAQEKTWENPNFISIEVENQRFIDLQAYDIIPETLEIFDNEGNQLSKHKYVYHSDLQRIELFAPQNVIIQFYQYPFQLNSITYNKDTSLILERYNADGLYEISKGMSLPTKPIFEGLQTEGSLVRGLSFGNNQGASVQSSLNLKMEGKLSENLNIKAHLADYNIPIEQNGYTQQINEFENISLSIYNENSSLNAGFLTLKQDQSYFANFEKKLTGVQLNTRLQHTDSFTDISGTASISRGLFHRMRFQAIEGNQGPYRLQGANNENFIVIIPFSEKVYIDGLILQRGENEDYTINYNTGEIIFTNNRLITGRDRITAEFQYTSLSYNRFLLYGKVNHSSEKLKIQASIYSESDAKNSPKNGNLTDEEKLVLSNAGNNENLLFVPSAQPSEYSENRILYQLVDTGGVTYYAYSNDPNQTLYQVSFTYVGANMGNYIKDQTTLNGRVYSYVPPIGGIPQGNYEPVKKLVSPQSQQVYALDSQYKLRNGGIQLNMALSNNDRNTFSKIDDQNNVGYAFRAKLEQQYNIKNWKLLPAVEYSFIQQNFYIIDRINKIEFNRDYNLNKEFDHINQQQLKLNIGGRNQYLDFNYSLQFLNRKEEYKGNSQFLDALYGKNNSRIIANFIMHQDEQNIGSAYLQDYRLEAQQRIRKNQLAIGAHIRNQHDDYDNALLFQKIDNQRYYVKNQYTDSLFFGYEAEVFYSINDSLRYQRNLDNISKGVNFKTHWRKDVSNGINLDIQYRDSDNQEILTTYSYNEKNLLSNINLNKAFWKNGLQFNVGYELGSGTEPQREFQYVEVSDGNGIYKWTDYNQDGIQEIDEFEIAEFQDLANYVRVYTNTIQYFKTAKNGLEFGLNVIPANIWNTDFAKRWKARINYKTNSAFLKNNNIAVFNPFEIENRRYLSENFIIDLGFNSINKNFYEIRYRYLTTDYERNDYLGIESILKKSHQMSIYNRLWENFTLENKLEWNVTDSYSETLSNKIYKFPGRLYQPSLKYEFHKSLKTKVFYQYLYRFNEFGNQKLNANEAGFELEYFPKSSTFLASFSYIQNRFEGDARSLIANQMMQGLKVGRNMVWQLSIQNQLANFLYLNISYQGRKSEENKVIHIGNAQVKFVF